MPNSPDPATPLVARLPFEPDWTIAPGATLREWREEVGLGQQAASAIPPQHVAGFEVRVMRADWDRHGKRAGYVRNVEMLNERPDVVLAFQRNGSRGTQHTVMEARRRGIPVKVFTELGV